MDVLASLVMWQVVNFSYFQSSFTLAPDGVFGPHRYMALCSGSRMDLISFSVAISASEDWLQTTVLNVLCGNQLCSLTRTVRVLVLRDSRWGYESEVTFPCSTWDFGKCRDYEGWNRMETERQLTGENQRISEPDELVLEVHCSGTLDMWKKLLHSTVLSRHWCTLLTVHWSLKMCMLKQGSI